MPAKRARDSESESESETESDASEIDEFDISAPPKTIWLSYKEFHGFLAPLLNSTSTRKKTVQNYIAPENIRGTTQRTSDFREGVWITASGRIDLEDPRSGIYKCKPEKSKDTTAENEESEDSDASDTGESTDTDDEPDDWDAEVANKSKEDLEKLAETEKKQMLVNDLKESFVDEHFVFHNKSKQHQARARELMDRTQALVEDWDKMKTRVGKQLCMKFHSAVHCEVPSFYMEFTKRSNVIKCSFDCKEFILRCQCLDTFGSMAEIVEHLQMSH